MRKIVIPLVGFALIGYAMAGKPWDEKPWTEWNPKEVEEVLEESPWSAQQGPGEVVYHVQWRSARPIRQALARAVQLNNPAATPDQVESVLESDTYQQFYILSFEPRVYQSRTESFEIGTSGARLQEANLGLSLLNLRQQMSSATTQLLKNSIYLVAKGKPKVYLSGYLSPREIGGDAGLMLFPRLNESGQPHFALEDKEVRLVIERNITNFGVTFNKGFKLQKMAFEGQLEL